MHLFKLLVNGVEREKLQSDFHDVSIAGFNTRPNEISNAIVQIEAFPKNGNWDRKESKPCV